jgi:hypothetical protein
MPYQQKPATDSGDRAQFNLRIDHLETSPGETAMLNIKTAVALAAATFAIGCTQKNDTTGPMDPNSVTVFTLSVQPGSVTGCILGDPSMTRPMTLTVKNDTAEILTAGGIHYGLDRVAPNVYAGGYRFKIRADLSVRPKRLLVTSNDEACRWEATAP